MTTTIYQIYCKDENIKEFYIGSTKNFNSRIKRHKDVCKDRSIRDSNSFLYQFIRDNGSFENWDFKVLNQTKYIDDLWKRKQEQCYIGCMKPQLNSVDPYVSIEDQQKRHISNCKSYWEKNKETLLDNMKEYRKNNKERIEEQRKDYYEENKECINEIRRERYKENEDYKHKIKEKAKKYRDNNREKVRESSRLYYKKNREKILEKLRNKE